MLDAGGEVDLRIETWAQSIFGIRKGRLNFDCAGLDFDLTIHVVDLTLIFVSLSVRKDHRELWPVLRTLVRVLVDSIGEEKIGLLADWEFDLDRIELRDGRQLRSWRNEIADLRLCDPRDPGDRRNHLGP